MSKSTITTVLPFDVHTVWTLVTDVRHYGWRSDLSRTEVRSEKEFVEYAKSQGSKHAHWYYAMNCYATTFTVTKLEYCKRWEFDMENTNMRGHWTGVFRSKGDNTEIQFTEVVTAKKWMLKPFVKGYLKKQQARFVADLKQALQTQGEKAKIKPADPSSAQRRQIK